MTCILILGVPRSGTSCVAGILSRLGVDMGKEIPQTDEWRCCHCSWELSEFLDQIPYLSDHQSFATEQDVLSMKEWIKNKIGIWGIKHYQLGQMINAFKDISDIKIIKTSRIRIHSLNSWKSLCPDDIEVEEFYKSLDNINNEVMKILFDKPTITIDYDALISDPKNIVQSIADFIELPLIMDAVDWVDINKRRFQ